MTKLVEQLNDEQRSEIKRQMAIYSQGVQEIIPTEELENKIAKSINDNKPINKNKIGMSKSKKNYIGIDESPKEMYRKLAV